MASQFEFRAMNDLLAGLSRRVASMERRIPYGQGIICSTSGRPQAPFKGMSIYDTDVDAQLIWNGSEWCYLVADGNYVPSTTNFAIGSDGTAGAEWVYHGTGSRGVLTVAFSVALGTTGITLPTGLMSISLPTGFTVDSSYSQTIPLGEVWFLDDTSTDFYGNIHRGGAGLSFYAKSVSGTYMARTATSGTVPFTWAASDALYGQAVIRGMFSGV
jgi:hypothetical protein